MSLYESTEKLELKYLDPERIAFQTNGTSLVRMTMKGICCFPSVLFFRCFPLGTKDNLISVRNGLDDGDTEVGLISNLDLLSASDRNIVEEKLLERYFVPVVQRIEKIEEFYGRYVFHVQTDKGFREVALRNIHEHIRFIGQKRLLIIDSDGCRYDIPNYGELDPNSQQILRKHVIT